MSVPADHSQRTTRFVVGIDLGTTNIAVSYVDLEGESTVQQFRIAQLVNAGEVGKLDTLPSFCYLPAGPELPEGALELPWRCDCSYAVGFFAREQGAAVPGRLVASAKSWLAHAGVDRNRKILPWGADPESATVSPIAVSRYFLEHVKAAWDHDFAGTLDRHGTPCRLAEQQVILTVPASFDEVARELTVQAAREAGIENLVLLEEPLAAFYAWLWQHESTWQELLDEGETVLVVDVGGGTTDFTLIDIEPGYILRRTAVGEHQLLGGDNMDMTLARQIEHSWQTRLDSRQWSMLCQQCRGAKELLLAHDAPESVKIGIAGSGSSVIASTRTHVLQRAPLAQTLLEGFFPSIASDSPPPERRAGIREMGLPYAADPAVTKHLLQFLRTSARTVGASSGEFVRPDRVLFNGGAMLPEAIRQRMLSVLEQWCGKTPGTLPELAATDLNLAVSRGAAYYGRVRRGQGVRVRGGIARAYYLEVQTGNGSELLCVMPRDAEEGRLVELQDCTFTLVANQLVRFPLYCSATRLGDRPGTVLGDREGITQLPALQTVLTYGRKKARELDVQLAARLNEVGTLELWCETADRTHRYPLSFDLRANADETATLDTGITLDAARLEHAQHAVETAFADSARLPDLISRLEKIAEASRNDWGLSLLRGIADRLLADPAVRLRTARHEARWLNLIGFCLRPGFGAPGDEWRMGELWKIWHAGPGAKRDAQVAAEWWVCWRRVAGGLREGQQQQIGNILLRDLIVKGKVLFVPAKRGVQEAVEMWRCLGALERLPIKWKNRTLQALLECSKPLRDDHFWVVARMGARRLFHGPQDRVIPAENIESVIKTLLRLAGKPKPPRTLLLAVSSLCRLCGVRNLDVAEPLRNQAGTLFERNRAPKEWRELLVEVKDDSREHQTEVLGDTVPLGLSLTAPPTDEPNAMNTPS